MQAETTTNTETNKHEKTQPEQVMEKYWITKGNDTHLPGSALIWTVGARTVTAASAKLLLSRVTSVRRRPLLLWGSTGAFSSSLSSISCCCLEAPALAGAAGFFEAAHEGQNQSPSGISFSGGSKQSAHRSQKRCSTHIQNKTTSSSGVRQSPHKSNSPAQPIGRQKRSTVNLRSASLIQADTLARIASLLVSLP